MIHCRSGMDAERVMEWVVESDEIAQAIPRRNLVPGRVVQFLSETVLPGKRSDEVVGAVARHRVTGEILGLSERHTVFGLDKPGWSDSHHKAVFPKGMPAEVYVAVVGGVDLVKDVLSVFDAEGRATFVGGGRRILPAVLSGTEEPTVDDGETFAFSALHPDVERSLLICSQSAPFLVHTPAGIPEIEEGSPIRVDKVSARGPDADVAAVVRVAGDLGGFRR